MVATPVTLRQVERALGRGELDPLLRALAAGDDADRVIGRALRRHRDRLRDDPALTLPAVYALVWFAAPQQPLRARMSAWVDEWRAAGRGRWLRALRPPTHSLDSPLVEEYRGPDARGIPWFSATGEVVGVATQSTEVVAWERATGARLSAGDARRAMTAPYRPPGALRCTHERDRLVIEGDGDPVTVELSLGPSHLYTFEELPGGRVLAGGWYCDNDGIAVCVDVAQRRVVWREEFGGPVQALYPSADGARVVVSGDGAGRTLLDCATGAELGWYPGVGGSVTVSPAGRELAVWTGSLLQVLVPHRAGSAWKPPSGTSVVAAQFSPDGALVLCDHVLYDAITGAPIERLDDLESTTYIEGGPAEGCTRVVAGGVVQLGALRGSHRWNARGQRVWTRRRPIYTSQSRIAISPDGSLFAVVPLFPARGAQRVEVRGVDDAAEVRAFDAASGPLAWSPSGRMLAFTRGGSLYVAPIAGDERLLGDFERVRHARFSRDGRTIAACADGRDRLWRIDGTPVADRRGGDDRNERAWARDVHGWAEFRAFDHDLRGAHAGDVFSVYGAGDDLIARAPCSEELVASPDGTRWAGRGHLFALDEGSVSE